MNKTKEVKLVPLTPADREQFIADNQEAFLYGAMFRFQKVMPKE
jgi:hypothetical protein